MESRTAEEKDRPAPIDDRLLLCRTLVDHIQDAIFIIAPEDSRFLDFNERACEMHGYRRKELLLLRVRDIDAGKARSAGFSWRQHVSRLRHQPCLLLESMHEKKDGTLFPVEASIQIVTVQGHEYIVSSARDITLRKTEEAKRTEALESKTADLVRTQKALRYLLEDTNDAKRQLEMKMAEIERMNHLFVRRELRMVELKEKIRELEQRVGEK